MNASLQIDSIIFIHKLNIFTSTDDNNRCRLQQYQDTDYINASFIDVSITNRKLSLIIIAWKWQKANYMSSMHTENFM